MDDEAAQIELASLIAAGGMTRDAVAEAVRQRLGRKKERPKASRVAGRFDGVAISVSGQEALTWERLISSLTSGLRTAKRLSEAGNDISAFGKAQAELSAR